jgi:hypothetical protein
MYETLDDPVILAWVKATLSPQTCSRLERCDKRIKREKA